ncbi:uncharacterized protein RJT21DRAFT_34384 [Scheffersomyces amazonensis]|uniref:uncharacterized protein n=1 Tax=Scheffersomyces amazonensis TaxID=1078765 RepID=UPI00315C8603
MSNVKPVNSKSSHLERTKSNSPPKDIAPITSGGSGKVYYSTGRGGAGNIKTSNTLPSPKLVPQGSATPKLQTPKITTGRGGYGNMINNDDPELARKLQDVDPTPTKSPKNEDKLYSVASNKSFSVGRGGFGNVVSTKSSGSQHSGDQPNNLYAVTSYNDKNAHKEKKGFLGKIKEIFGS